MKINLAIVGYGNIGKAIEKNAKHSDVFELVGIFSRRGSNAGCSPFDTPFFEQKTLLDDAFCKKIDVLMLCVGSAFDLEDTALKLATKFSTVDSFDTHAKMREYVRKLNSVNKTNKTLSFVGCGWDPGIFSLQRALFASVMPSATPLTFWGKGVSQGHSEAVRKIDGVKYATQYTVPKTQAVELAKNGKTDFLTREKHERVCYVVADFKSLGENVTDEQKQTFQERIKEQIINMPNYFADYDTTVYFVDEDEYFKSHTEMSHAGQVIAVEKENECIKNSAEFLLKLSSNPDFTAQVMLAYSKANYMMRQMGETGAKTILDIPIKYLAGDDFLKFV